MIMNMLITCDGMGGESAVREHTRGGDKKKIDYKYLKKVR